MTTRRGGAWLLAGALALGAPEASAGVVCIEGVTVVGGDFDEVAVRTLERLAPPCVRVRFRQDVWTSLDDDTPRGPAGRSLFEAYDALVGLYRALGSEVVMVVGADAVGRRTEDLQDAAARAEYARVFGRVVARYAGRVMAFELLDEPNRRAVPPAAGPNALDPEAYAGLVLRSWEEAARRTAGGACARYRVLLGGLREGPTPDAVGDHLSTYLDAVYAWGYGTEGWTAWREREGRLPFDGIAVHLRGPERQPGLSTDLVVTGAVDAALASVAQVVARREGRDARREVWFTEAGWPSRGTAEDDRFQADALTEIYRHTERTLLPSGAVALVSWYAFVDPPFDRGGWGLYRDGVIARSTERPAHGRFFNVSSRYRPAFDAQLAWTEPEVRLRPGERYEVVLRVTNRGPMTTDTPGWTERGGVQIGAVDGCAGVDGVNQVAWTGFPHGGRPGVADARADLPRTMPWWSGVIGTVSWEIVAPAAPGRYALAARMVRDGHVWFGSAATATVAVDAPTPDAGRADAAIPADGAHDAARFDAARASAAPADTGCGCHASARRSGTLAGLLALAAWCAVRRRGAEMRPRGSRQ